MMAFVTTAMCLQKPSSVNKNVMMYDLRCTKYTLLACLLLSLTGILQQPVKAQKPRPVKPVLPVEAVNGKFVYIPDSLGNRIPDFSYCGYMASEKAIPDVAIKIIVPFKTGDATARIQAAINYVASLPLDKNGFRGTVLLEKGVYEIDGYLKLNASGVVLRGSGTNETTLLGAGTDRQTLVRIVGKNDSTQTAETKITDSYVPVNAFSVTVASAAAFQKGDHIMIHRPSTKEWIHDINMETFGGGISALGWKAGERDIYFDRKIIKIEGNTLTFDAPLTTALDAKYGGGLVATYQWKGRINNIGIENIRFVSAVDQNNPKDEAHRWMAITIDNAEDAWVRRINFEHFAGSAVRVLETAKRITIEDCKSFAPVSEIGGERRYTFYTTGQQTLVQRCVAEQGYHDFATGYCAAGPNAFVQCESHQPYSFSGAIDSWGSGILFDVVSVDGNALRFGNREQDGQGAGWSAANSLFWNCSAARIDCYKPPTAQNWSYASWAQFGGDGYWYGSNESINPRSFYYTQLAERLGKNVDEQAQVLKVETNASSSPTVEEANRLIAASTKPHIQMTEWIDGISQRAPLTTTASVKTIDQVGIPATAIPTASPAMVIQNGWLVRGSKVLTGRREEVPWWTGGVQATDLKNAKPALTRFVPGRTGKGLTDDLDELTDAMLQRNVIGMEQHYALWYERRRDDHERIRRMDGEVWPPFYELPFARTGREYAWDGLSKYDLTQYNKWYWSRLKQYADLADQKGLVLVHENYFQHNIIEAGAHYADFPWRPANNVNSTGFPEPPPFAGDKRIFMAEQFYDENDPTRRELHRKYIRQCLDNFKDNNGVIQEIGEEFTGPLHFVQFWLDVIKEWEKETGKKQIIGLSTTKDVQDAILADPAYVATINLIDIKYWNYQVDASTYAPPGGQNLAPRQWARLMKPKRSSFEQVYRAVKEYRDKYPGKAITYSGEGLEFGWAVFMAGGSLAAIPVLPAQLLADASAAHPVQGNTAGQWSLVNEGKAYIVYTTNGTVQVQVPNENDNYHLRWIDTRNGHVISETAKTKGKELANLKAPQANAVLWASQN